jgi:heptosyltransferase-2
LVINLEEDKETCKFATSLKSSKKIGFLLKDDKIVPTPTIKEWFDMSALGKKPFNDILKKKNKKTHRQILSEILEIENYERYEPFLRLNSEQRKIAEDFFRRNSFSKKDLIIGISCGSADRWPKQLPIKKTAELINLLSKKLGAKIILFGGPEEIERNKEIHKFLKVSVVDSGCGNNLTEFPALMSLCHLIVSTDSFGLHVALALKRKTICLIGPTSFNEIDMYELGEKIIAKSDCTCCYKKDCKSMERIKIEEILLAAKKLLNEKITLLITGFKEPNISKAIESALNQETDKDYEIIVCSPDLETLEIANKYALKNKKIKVVKDPGKGKVYALNIIFSKIQTDILILTDADVYISKNVIEEMSNLFLNPEIGCVSGRPVPQEGRSSKYGYWANFLFDSANRIRKEAYKSNSFIECSGYLFAFRKEKIKRIPLNVAEDSIIPYFFWQKGYRIGYAENAKVFVKNASRLDDWIKQKIRTNKSHKAIKQYAEVDITPQVKTFRTESKGIFWLLAYFKNFKEFFWTSQLIIFRLYVWARYYLDTSLFNKNYSDGWERINSTR